MRNRNPKHDRERREQQLFTQVGITRRQKGETLETRICRAITFQSGVGTRRGTILAALPCRPMRPRSSLRFALRSVRKLKEGGKYDEPGLSLIVTNEMGEQIFVIPF
jgi:hypothetical protein